MSNYRILAAQARELLLSEPHYVPALSNLSALLIDSLADLNWAGFYLMREGQLVVGPFQGKPACIHIAVGSGVCGTAVQEDAPQLVPDVHEFPGHIACDAASASEVVIPLHAAGCIVGVLDMDSPKKGRFAQEDLEGLLLVTKEIEEHILWE